MFKDPRGGRSLALRRREIRRPFGKDARRRPELIAFLIGASGGGSTFSPPGGARARKRAANRFGCPPNRGPTGRVIPVRRAH